MHRTAARHVARLAAGLSVAAAAALLAAAPAQAATPVIAKTESAGKVLRIVGSDGQESVLITRFNGAVTVSNTLGSVQAGPGCVQIGSAAACGSAVTLIGYSGGPGDDSVRNDTSITLSGHGGAGSDRLNGGPGNDRFQGFTGVDFINGGGGTDTCDAENEAACELDFLPPPRIRVPS